MSNLKNLRLRIKSVKSTKKITKAMQMISAAKLRKARIGLDNAYYYHNSVKNGLDNAVVSSDELSSLAKAMMNKELNLSKPKLVIVFASDRGLCGGFNQNMIRMIKSNLIESSDIHLIAIGKRMIGFVNTHYPENLLAEYTNIEMNDENISQIANNIISMLNDNSISGCELYFNFFQNTLTQVPTQKTIIPFAVDTESKKTELVGEDILNKLLHMYIMSEIKYAFLQSNASEEAARTTAMDNATRNAGDLIDKLTLILNRQRQANITKELTEIISGAEAV